MIDHVSTSGDLVIVDLHCAKCGADDDLTVYAYPGLPMLALCARCEQKES